MGGTCVRVAEVFALYQVSLRQVSNYVEVFHYCTGDILVKTEVVYCFTVFRRRLRVSKFLFLSSFQLRV